MFAVASSINTIFEGFSIALAIEISCLSPTDKFYPFSVISVSKPFLYVIIYLKAH
jgi:hypothetical protein